MRGGRVVKPTRLWAEFPFLTRRNLGRGLIWRATGGQGQEQDDEQEKN